MSITRRSILGVLTALPLPFLHKTAVRPEPTAQDEGCPPGMPILEFDDDHNVLNAEEILRSAAWTPSPAYVFRSSHSRSTLVFVRKRDAVLDQVYMWWGVCELASLRDTLPDGRTTERFQLRRTPASVPKKPEGPHVPALEDRLVGCVAARAITAQPHRKIAMSITRRSILGVLAALPLPFLPKAATPLKPTAEDEGCPPGLPIVEFTDDGQVANAAEIFGDMPLVASPCNHQQFVEYRRCREVYVRREHALVHHHDGVFYGRCNLDHTRQNRKYGDTSVAAAATAWDHIRIYSTKQSSFLGIVQRPSYRQAPNIDSWESPKVAGPVPPLS